MQKLLKLTNPFLKCYLSIELIYSKSNQYFNKIIVPKDFDSFIP